MSTGEELQKMARIYDSCMDLMRVIEASGKDWQNLGAAPDGSPLVAVRSGGDRVPSIFMTAGSHSTEQAGLTAAVGFIDEQEPSTKVYIIPTRDPIGMHGLRRPCSGAPVAASSVTIAGDSNAGMDLVNKPAIDTV